MGPFDRFWVWLQVEFWTKLRDQFASVAAWAVDKYLTVAKLYWAVVAALASFFLTMISLGIWAIQQISDSLSSIDLQAIKTGSASLLQYGAFINRFIPLVEGASVAIIVFNIWLGVTVIRWVKSIIPTIAN